MTPIDERWVDIVPPSAPPPGGESTTLLIVAIVLATLLAAGIYAHTRPRRRARRELGRLARELRRSEADCRSLCFRLRHCLRSGLHARRLQDVKMAPGHRRTWRIYVGRLRKYCFAAEPPGHNELHVMIEQARSWLSARSGDR